MKIEVKRAFPHSLTSIIKLGINPKCANHFVKVFPPDYTKGRVRRYSKIPEGINDACKIIHQGGSFAVVKAFSDAANEGLFFGTEEQCRQIIRTTLQRWWSLPRGREIRVIVQEFEEANKPKRKTRKKK
jgi:hypothetical protein